MQKSNKYKIDVIDTDKSKIIQRNNEKDGILPKYPFSWLLSGRSGAGKTNLLMNILTKKEMYGGFFHYILVFSPTAGYLDDSYKSLKLPKENFIKEFTPEMLQKIIDKRDEQIKQMGHEGVSKKARMLIILDDVIADSEFLKSPEALKMLCLLRHYQVSVMILLQSYNKLPPALRKNCNAICVFPSIQSEIEVLIDEITPAGIKKRDFEKVIDYCTSGKYDFLYINYHADKDKQIRKNLEEIITKEKVLEIAPPKEDKKYKKMNRDYIDDENDENDDSEKNIMSNKYIQNK